MKVLFLVSNLMSGGVERTVVYLSSYFSSRGVDTHILTLSDEIFYSVDSRVKLHSLHISRGYKGLVDRTKKMIARYFGVNTFLRDNCFDCVFCMTPEMIRYLSKKTQKRKNYKLITSERNNPLFDSKKNKRLKKRVFYRCDGIVFQTERALNCFPDAIKKRGIIIPNAVGNDLAYTIIADPFKTKKISAIGRLSPQKDFNTLIKAFSIFSIIHNDYELNIYGDGPLKKELMEFAKSLKIEEKVVFKGASKDALKEISDSSMFIMSSIYEGMPNALMEAMAIGLPCISTDCPFGPSELITNGVNGFLVPVGDSRSLAKAMDDIVNDKDNSLRIGINARNILNSNSISTIAEKFLNYVRRFN